MSAFQKTCNRLLPSAHFPISALFAPNTPKPLTIHDRQCAIYPPCRGGNTVKTQKFGGMNVILRGPRRGGAPGLERAGGHNARRRKLLHAI